METAGDRQDKLQRLQDAGEAPYAVGPSLGPRRPIAEALASCDPDAEPRSRVVVAGRITARRDHGNSMFFDVRDGSGNVQAYVRRNDLGPDRFVLLRENLDLGDFVTLEGELGRTRAGEATVFVAQLELLTKSLTPLPKEHFGLADTETRLRQRYLDLVANRDTFDRFATRSAIVRELRTSLEDRGFMEVETPLLHTIAGGATARPFTTHHEKYDLDLYLRIAPELFLKRLLVGGYERVFEIGRSFRNEGISPRHHPEFTMLEAYWAYARAPDWMELLEHLVCDLMRRHPRAGVGEGQPPDASGEAGCAVPFARHRYADLLAEHAGVDVFDGDSVRAAAKRVDIDAGDRPVAHIADDVFGACVEHHLVAPTFVIDFPVELSPLARCSPDDPRVAERFELYVGGMEIANGFSELNDPAEQLARFEEQVARKDPELPGEVDSDYVEALRCGMPPAAGIGIGVDRLVMLVTGAESIRDVILFPLLRPASKG